MTVGAVILAAGAGRRMGGVAKALLDAGGVSFLSAVATCARAVGTTELVVVVGPPYANEVAAEAARLDLAVAHNPRPERGMASSVAVGFAHAIAAFSAEGALLWPVDHPYVEAATARAVVSRGAADRIVVPTHGGRGGHPTWFGRAVWAELADCDRRPDGARDVVRADPSRVVRLAHTDAAVVRDVDAPGDRR